ncbi:Small GTPase superfamily, Rab type [Parasponia andersonii]|uniref:Small GTPase superfamily, Rab type n=1 Tax=Parasponia andersonii TaxID=3476 RepID=A0A2P5AD74_PARAD|nr:Small GTPase superfamily, Rab type [Parasponia andersonii]
MAKIIKEAKVKMTQICRRVVHVNIRWSILERVSIIKQFFRFIWDRIVVCSIGKPIRYRRLPCRSVSVRNSAVEAMEDGSASDEAAAAAAAAAEEESDSDPDSVTLKISLLGDCQIGKTSFAIKYVGDEQEKKCLNMSGLNLMDKTLVVQGARISFSIWDVGGDQTSLTHVPIACKDAVAILFMFDLTSRCTLNSVIGWYSHARKWNQTAIPILIGTKFDDFAKLPPDLQWTIVTQARAYARAMNATLFFSSATHNINVNKIFKFIMAKLFNLPWTVERNLTIGEPIIDF